MRTLEKPAPTDPARDVRRAWWSLALYLPSFVLAFVVGEGMATALGVSEAEDVSWWVYPVVGIPACLVFALPLLVTAVLSRRAVGGGRRDGWWPVLVGGLVAGMFLLLNLVNLALVLLLG
jgi:hypothetical protein